MADKSVPEVVFILLKGARGKLAIGKGRCEEVEVEAGSILSPSRCQRTNGSAGRRILPSSDCASGDRRLLLNSLDVRDLTVKCRVFEVELICARHAFLLLACRDFRKRLRLYKDFEMLEMLLCLRNGDLVFCCMENGVRLPGRVRSIGQFSPHSLAVHFDVELEEHFGKDKSDTRLLLSVDQLSLPLKIDGACQVDDKRDDDPVVKQSVGERRIAEPKPLLYFTSEPCKPDAVSVKTPCSVEPAVAYVPCVSSAELKQLVGKVRGIQGSLNSCYMDATLFSMFACTDIFDSYLLRPVPENQKQRQNIIELLKTDIVYPLRKHFYTPAEHVLEFRRLLSDFVPDAKGFTEEEKDPEEFLELLFRRILFAEPEVVFSSGQSSHLLQLINAENSPCADGKSVVTVQQLLERSVFDLAVLLRRVPTRLIVQIPRYGKEKLFRAVVPSLRLDISSVLLFHPHACWRCDRLAQLQCKECYLVCTEQLSSTFFCTKCFHEFHSELATDQDHAVVLLRPQSNHRVCSPVVLNLSSVLCIESSHYVCFSRVGSGANAEWIFFDSMADREGETLGHNLPEVRLCPDFDHWLCADNIETLVASVSGNAATLPSYLNRLVSDCYLCFYYWPEGLLYS